MKEREVLYEIKSLEKTLARKFISENNLEEKEYCCKFTPTQMQIIEYMLKHIDQDIYQKDLEEVLNLRRATVSGVLQTMEKNKLIERVTDIEDTRTKRIILHEEAKSIFKKHKDRLNKLEASMIKGIDEKQLENFIKVLHIMKNNLRLEK